MDKNLQALNKENKLALWAERISECRNSGETVKSWCKENGISEPTYYRWQSRLFEMSKEQHERNFVEVTPIQSSLSGDVAITVRIRGAEAEIRRGAEASTIETVLRVLKSC